MPLPAAITFVVVLASLELVAYLCLLAIGRLFSTELEVKARDSLATLAVLTGVALFFASGAAEHALDALHLFYFAERGEDSLESTYMKGVALYTISMAINALVSVAKTIKGGAGVSFGVIAEAEVQVGAFLDPFDRMLDALLPFFTYVMLFSQLVLILLKYTLEHFSAFMAVGAVLLVPKIIRPVGAMLIAFAIAFALIMPSLVYLFHNLHSYDYDAAIQELEQKQSALEGAVSSIVGFLKDIKSFLSSGDVVNPFTALVKALFAAIFNIFKHLLLDLLIIPVLSFLLALTAMVHIARLLNSEALDNMIVRTLGGAARFSRFR
jgi:hypothetical protein